MNEQFEEIVESFITNKIGISDFFLTAKLAVLLQKHIHRLHENGQMAEAGIGNDTTQSYDRKIRSDKIHWLDKKNKHTEELGFLEYVEEFIEYLNKTCYTGINDYEFHYALYEEGSFYKRHTDQFKTNNNRKYSLISYLNDDWLQADGGQLWVHQNGETEKILPTCRKAVFFESNILEHEVTIASRPRMSVTGWLKRI
jgi:SM-20-related protein